MKAVLAVLVLLVIASMALTVLWLYGQWRCLDGCFNAIEFLSAEFGVKLDALRPVYEECVMRC